MAGDMAPGQGTPTLTLPDGRRVLLDQDKVTLGRLPECEIAVADASVSRRHAEVRRGGNSSWQVADLGSTNGTKVNGTRDQRASPNLDDGDEITVGSTTVRFEAERGDVSGPSGPTVPRVRVLGAALPVFPQGAPRRLGRAA